jgi:hypothetical protein
MGGWFHVPAHPETAQSPAASESSMRLKRTFMATGAGLAILVLLPIFLFIQGERRAEGRYTGELAWQASLANAVAAHTSPGSLSHSGSGELFDAEWTLVTCQMTVLGLGQVILAHAETRDDYLPAMRRCSTWLASPEARAFGSRKWGQDPLDASAAQGTHAYLGYIHLALSMHRRIEPDVDWAPTHDRVQEVLLHALENPIHQIQTYPGETYPADIAAVVGGVALYGADTTEVVERLMKDAVDPHTGMLFQALSPTGGPADGPRGSGTAIAAYFLSFSDTAASASLYQSLQRDSFLGVTGIREYPHGEEGWGDVDSGPVVFGLGVSATGFALAGAKMHQDRPTYRAVHRTAGVFGLPGPALSGRWYYTGGRIGNAILLAMLTARDLRTPPG